MPSSFWVTTLRLVSIGVAVFGLALVLAPGLTLRGFSWMVYANAGRLPALGGEAVRYISLVHAVLGAVMCGWGIMLTAIVHTLVANGSRLGWRLVTGSLLTWYLPDTSYSLLSGYWQNALLNTVFALLFAVPLLAIKRHCEVR